MMLPYWNTIHELRNYWIITEDRPMLDEGVTNKMDMVSLIDFFGDLFMKKELTSSQILQVIKIFSQWKNISQNKTNNLLRIINNK